MRTYTTGGVSKDYLDEAGRAALRRFIASL
jgi:hypothetical protein